MDFALSPEQEMIVTTVRDFVETEIYPHEDLVERSGEVGPPPRRPRAGDQAQGHRHGVLCLQLPRGGRWRRVGATRLHRWWNGSLGAVPWRSRISSGGRRTSSWPARATRRSVIFSLPSAGRRMDALAMTEPQAGSDVRGMACTAVRDGGDSGPSNGTKHLHLGREPCRFRYRLSWQPAWTTRHGARRSASPVSSWIAGIPVSPSATAMPRSATGDTRTASSNSTDCRLPDAQVLGEVDGGFERDEHMALRHTPDGCRQFRGPGAAVLRSRRRGPRRRSASSSASPSRSFRA